MEENNHSINYDDIFNHEMTVKMSIYESLEDSDPKNYYVPPKNQPLDNVNNCKKIDFTLHTKHFASPLTITFMWNGDKLYFNYFRNQQSTKTYAFNSWRPFNLESECNRRTSAIRVLHRLAVNGKLNDNEKKLLMLAMIYQISAYVQGNNYTIWHTEDCKTISEIPLDFIDKVQETNTYNDIRDEVKQDKLCTKKDFTEKMNSFFKKQQQQDTLKSDILPKNIAKNINFFDALQDEIFDPLDDDLYDALVDAKNRCLNDCVTCLNNCWASIKSRFGGE